MKDISILWFRKDLRLDDNLALLEASKHEKIYPIFIFDETLDEYKNIGEASHWWLENSLMKLKLDLDHKLSILNGKSLDIISAIIERYNVKSVYWNRCYEPDRIAADKVIKEHQLSSTGNKCKDGDDHVYIGKIIEIWECCVGVITSWQTSHTDKVHGEEYPVSTDGRYPEMYIPQVLVHHSPFEHLREPVINSGE